MDMNLNEFWEVLEDRGAWCATVSEVTKSQTWLSNFPANTFPGDGLYFECNACIMEKSPAFESERHRTDAHLCHCLADWPQGIFNFCWQKSGILGVDHNSIADQLETHSADFRFLVSSSWHVPLLFSCLKNTVTDSNQSLFFPYSHHCLYFLTYHRRVS